MRSRDEQLFTDPVKLALPIEYNGKKYLQNLVFDNRFLLDAWTDDEHKIQHAMNGCQSWYDQHGKLEQATEKQKVGFLQWEKDVLYPNVLQFCHLYGLGNVPIVSGYRIAVYSVRTKYRPCVRYEPPVYHWSQ